MAIAANGETTSRSFSRLFRRRTARPARPATATASSGRIDITGSKPLSFHHGHVVDLEGGLVPHEGDQDAEGDGNLRDDVCDLSAGRRPATRFHLSLPMPGLRPQALLLCMILSKEIGEGIGRQQSPPDISGRGVLDQGREWLVGPDPSQCLFVETATKSVIFIEGRNDFRDLTPREIAGFTNCLRHGNIVFVGDFGMRTEKQMMLTPIFGRKSRD